MTDEETIRRVLAGDLDCFGLLVEKHQRRIIGMAYNMTGDHQLAEDIGQEAFLAVYRDLVSFDPARSQFSTWLYRIAKNKVLNALKRRKPVFLRDDSESPSPQNPYRDIAASELHAELDRILDSLPASQRLAFVWAEIEGLSYREIAEIEGTSLGSVKSRINRARRRLQSALKDRSTPCHE